MGQSSSRPAASSRASFRTSRLIPYEHTRPYGHSDDALASPHDAPNQRRRTVSHRSEAQSTKSSRRHQRTVSGHTAPVVNRTGQRGPLLPKTSSRRNYTTSDKRDYYDETRRNDKALRSINSKPRSRLSVAESRHRRSRPRKVCVVCTDSRSLSHFPFNPPTTRCAHDIDVCSECLRRWISTSFSSRTWDDINCPTCAERLGIDDVQEFAPSEVFRKYKKLHTKAELEAMPGFHWCITKGCKSGQTIAPGTGKFKCVCCKQMHCMEHNMPWHKGETCRQYESRKKKKVHKEEEEASKKYLKQNAKRCPGCKRPIEKINGCDHMTCTKCRHEFCWECLATYEKPRDVNSVFHRVECPHYNRRINGPPA